MKNKSNNEELSGVKSTIDMTEDRRCSWIRLKLTRLYKYCEAYGSIIAYYGASFGALVSSVIVTVLNEFEGGCKYPYLSEVARGGVGWLAFLIGTGVGWIPWIIFSLDYFRVFSLYGMTIADPSRKRRYMFSQKLQLCLLITAAISMHGVAFFDMGHYPMTHEICVILFAGPLNLQYLINFYEMQKYGNQHDFGQICFKAILILCSCGGIILFTVLGSIEHCKSVVITLEECLQLTSEDQCFAYIDEYRDGWTVLRNYPRCLVMHFWRGLSEFVCVLCSAMYLYMLYDDRNSIQLQLFKRYGILPTNSYVVKELLRVDEELYNHLSPTTIENI